MKGHTRFVAVAGLLPSGKAVDANLRKLQIVFWEVVCANVRACKIVRPSVLIAMSRFGPRAGCKSSDLRRTGLSGGFSCSPHHVDQLT